MPPCRIAGWPFRDEPRAKRMEILFEAGGKEEVEVGGEGRG